MRDSIFYTSIRSFFIAFFSILGLLFGVILIMLLLGSLSLPTDLETETVYTPEIVANAQGVRKPLSSDSPVILKLNIKGVIGLESLTTDSVRTQLMESREGVLKDRVKAILLHIETPGGTVTDSDGIYHALKAYKEQYKVPVIAFVDGQCTSGGMYIACSADKVLASDVSLIGSVGVITSPFFNVYQLLDKYGVQSLTLSAGKGKDDLSMFRQWRPDEDENYKLIINHFYEDFVNIVVANRPKIDKTKLIKVYGANVFPATQAKEYGYIDESGYSLNQALDMLAKQLGIMDDYYLVVQLEKKVWYNELLKGEYNLLKGKVKHQVELSPEMDPKLMNQFLYLYRP